MLAWGWMTVSCSIPGAHEKGLTSPGKGEPWAQRITRREVRVATKTVDVRRVPFDLPLEREHGEPGTFHLALGGRFLGLRSPTQMRPDIGQH